MESSLKSNTIWLNYIFSISKYAINMLKFLKMCGFQTLKKKIILKEDDRKKGWSSLFRWEWTLESWYVKWSWTMPGPTRTNGWGTNPSLIRQREKLFISFEWCLKNPLERYQCPCFFLLLYERNNYKSVGHKAYIVEKWHIKLSTFSFNSRNLLSSIKQNCYICTYSWIFFLIHTVWQLCPLTSKAQSG